MKNTIYVLIFSVSAFVISFLALDNIFISLAIMVIYGVTFYFVFIPMIKKYKLTSRKYHECYHFINNFIIALSIKKATSGSLETTVNSMPTEFIEMYEGLDNLSDREKINYLESYFPFHVYHLFIQIVELWEEEGGDILQMSKYLINEIRLYEEYITKVDGLSSHKYVEVGVLWGFCLLIVVILRFVLKDFYASIKSQILYMISISALMIFVLFSVYLLVIKGTSLKIKGSDEK